MVVQVTRLQDGDAQIVSIAEVLGVKTIAWTCRTSSFRQTGVHRRWQSAGPFPQHRRDAEDPGAAADWWHPVGSVCV